MNHHLCCSLRFLAGKNGTIESKVKPTAGSQVTEHTESSLSVWLKFFLTTALRYVHSTSSGAMPASSYPVQMCDSCARCHNMLGKARFPPLSQERLSKQRVGGCFPARSESDRTKKNVNMHYLRRQEKPSYPLD